MEYTPFCYAGAGDFLARLPIPQPRAAADQLGKEPQNAPAHVLISSDPGYSVRRGYRGVLHGRWASNSGNISANGLKVSTLWHDKLVPCTIPILSAKRTVFMLRTEHLNLKRILGKIQPN